MRRNGTYPGKWTKPAAQRYMEAKRNRNRRLHHEAPSRSRARRARQETK